MRERAEGSEGGPAGADRTQSAIDRLLRDDRTDDLYVYRATAGGFTFWVDAGS